MATPAQITANRANAQKSTGPRSPDGKAASRFNALKHGLDAESVIIPGEDPAEYETLAANYRDEFHPTTPSEAFLVDTMIRADWNKRRLQPVETELYGTVLAENPGGSLVAGLLSGSPAAKLLTRIQRQILAFERAWYRAHDQLQRARRSVQAEEEEAFKVFLDRACIVPQTPKLASFPESAVSLPLCPSDLGPEAEERSPGRLSNPALRL